MKSLRTKVIMSAFVLLFALVATIGSTYAWFTVSSETTVDAIQLDVTTEDSLLIRLYDGENQTTADAWLPSDYYRTVTNTQLTNSTTYSGWAAWELKPLTAATSPTTTNGTDYTTVSPYNLSTMSISTNRALSAGTANTADGGYVEIKFWVMSQEAAHTITLQNLAITTGGTTSIVNAISLGTMEDDLEATTPNRHVFSLDADYGFSFSSADTGYLAEDGSHQNADMSYWNAVAVPATLVGAHSLFYGTSDVANESTTTIGSAATVASLDSNSPELVTVRIWLEGWDLQADNDIMAASFSISFGFKIKG
jgi:hypothetical protein